MLTSTSAEKKEFIGLLWEQFQEQSTYFSLMTRLSMRNLHNLKHTDHISIPTWLSAESLRHVAAAIVAKCETVVVGYDSRVVEPLWLGCV